MMSIEEMVAFCKRRGFIYLSSEIYGGLSGFFDYVIFFIGMEKLEIEY